LADLTLRISSDFSEASKAFKELADSSEEVRNKIEKFSDSFKSENISKFIDKQKLLEISLKGSRGEVGAMTAAENNYKKEIEKLIRSGLDPESDAIQRLREEHDKLADKIKETNEVQKKQDDLMKNAEKAALGMFAAIGAGIATVGALTQKMAEAGDEYAKTSRIIGMTAETFQELEYAAKMSGIDNLDSSLQKLNKSVADVKSGTGTLTSYLKETDKQLLSQIENVKSNEDAFNLLMDAINKAPDEFSKAELAQAAFGKSGQQLILLANEGAEGITALREEARKYGIISNEAAADSEAYLDAQSRLKSALFGVRNELTAGLIPGLTNGINKIADFIAGIDDWESKLENITYILAGVTAGITAFLIVAKGSTIIHGLATAFKALTSAIAANPIGAIAVVITAVLIPALLYLYKNWDTVSTYLQQGIARLQFAFNWLASIIQEGLVVAFNTVKAAGVTLVDFIYGNIIRAVGNMLELMGKIPFVGDLFQAASEKVKSFGNAIGNLAEETRQSSRDAIQAAHEKQNATEAELKTTLATIDTEAKARRDSIEAQKKANQELSTRVETTNNDIVEDTKKTQDEITETVDKSTKETEKKILTLVDKLRLIPLTESQQLSENINQFSSFLKQRLDLERLDGEERIAWLQEQAEQLLSIETISAEEKKAAVIAINNQILEEQKKLNESLIEKLNEIPPTEQAIQTERINQFSSFLKQRLEAEKLDGEDRISFLNEQAEQLMLMDSINADEKIALEIALNEKILEEREKLNESLVEKLNEIPLTEQAIQTQQIEQLMTFLGERLNLENLDGEERISYLKDFSKQMMTMENLNAKEKIALEKATAAQIEKEEKKLKETQDKILAEKLGAFSTYFKGIGDLAALASDKSVGLAILEKGVASAQALINSYLAFTEALSSVPYPFNIAAAAGVLASGIAAQVKILSTPIKSAETGGRFIVPNSVGSDNTLMRVNSGEEVDITPRGMSGKNTQNIIVQIEKQTIFDVINDGIRGGDILVAAVNY
jgi:hypothetical protein